MDTVIILLLLLGITFVITGVIGLISRLYFNKLADTRTAWAFLATGWFLFALTQVIIMVQ